MIPAENSSEGETVRGCFNNALRSPFVFGKVPEAYSNNVGKTAKTFHGSFPQYRPTPLVRLDALAGELGVSQILVKDESYRFGLNSFKVLGGSFAIGKLLSRRLGLDIDRVSFDFLKSRKLINKLGVLTFTTASDGNHGRGVAWTAGQLGHKAVIFLPKGTVNSRIDAIRETGAEVIITEFDYDQAVRLARESAEKNGWELIQETAFEDYCEIPEWIMQGYTTMVIEALEQMHKIGIERPSHIFLQAGVGSMSAAVLGYFLNEFVKSYPGTIIIEPHQAACFYDSAKIGDGQPHRARGNLKTMMAGLSCGVPSTIAWEILNNFSDAMISCPDYVAEAGMRIYARPIGDDKKIISGESGAVSIGLLSAIMKDNRYTDIKEQLCLNDDSVVFLINTEGATNPDNYRKIVGG